MRKPTRTIQHEMIAVGFGVLVLAIATAGAGMRVRDSLDAALHDTMRTGDVLRNHMEADMMHDALRADVLSAILASDPVTGLDIGAVKAELAEHAADFRKAVAENGELAQDPSTRAALEKVKAPLETCIASAIGLVDVAASDRTAALARLPGFKAQFKLLEGAMEEASNSIEGVAHATAAAAVGKSAFGHDLLFGAIAAGAALAVMLMVFARLSVTDPIRDLALGMNELAQGRLDVALNGTERRDEVGRIGRAVRALQDILAKRARAEAEAQVADMARIVNEIARSAKGQAGSLREVSAAADQMDKVTQQNAAMVEQTTAAAQSLAGGTEQLAKLTERFRTKSATSGGWGSSAAAPRPRAPAAPVPQMRAGGRGGAVPKPAAQPGDWEEF